MYLIDMDSYNIAPVPSSRNHTALSHVRNTRGVIILNKLIEGNLRLIHDVRDTLASRRWYQWCNEMAYKKTLAINPCH